MRVLRKVVPKRLLLSRKKRNWKDAEDFEYSSDEDEYDDSDDEEDYEEDECSDSDESEEEYEEEVEEGGDDEDEQEDEDEDDIEEEDEDDEVDEEDEDDDNESYYDNNEDEESIEIEEDQYYNSKTKGKRLSIRMTPKSGKFSEYSASPTKKNFFKALKLGLRRKTDTLSPGSRRQYQDDEYEEEEDDEEDEEEDYEDEESEDNSSTVSGHSSTEEGSDEISGNSAQSSSSQRDFFSFDDDAEDVKLPKSLTRRQRRNYRRKARHGNPLTPTKRIMNTLKALTPTRKKMTPKQEQIEAENAARAMEAADALGRDLEAMGFNLSCQSFLSSSTLESAAKTERYGTAMQSDSESINLAAPSTVMSSRTPRNAGSPHSFKLVKSSQSGGSSGIMQSRSPLPPPTPEESSRVKENSPKIDDKLDKKLEELQQSSFASDDDNMSRMERILTTDHSNHHNNNIQNEVISNERKRWFLSPKQAERRLGHPKTTSTNQDNENADERHQSPNGSHGNTANSLLTSINSPIPSPIEKTLSSVSRNSQNSQSQANSSYVAEASGRETENDYMSSYKVQKPEASVDFGRQRSGMSSTKFTGPEPPPDLESVQPMERTTLSSLIRTIATQTSDGSHSDAEKILSVSQTMSKDQNKSEQSSGETNGIRDANAQQLVEGESNNCLRELANNRKLFEAKSCDESSKGATRCDSTIHTIQSMDVKSLPVVIEGMSFMEDKAETAIATEPSGLSQSMTTRAKIARAKLLKIVMDRKEQESLSQSNPDRQMHVPSPIPEKSAESRILHPKRDPRKRVPTPFPGISAGHRRSYSRQDIRVPSPIPEIRSSKSRRTLESSRSSSTRKKEKVQSVESTASNKMQGVLRASSYSPSPIIKHQKPPRTLLKSRHMVMGKKATVTDKKISRALVPLPSFGINHVKQWVLNGMNKRQNLLQFKMGDQQIENTVENSNTTFGLRKSKTSEKKLEQIEHRNDVKTCLESGNAEIKCSAVAQLQSPNEKKRRVRFSLRKHSPAVSKDSNKLYLNQTDMVSDDDHKATGFFDEHERTKMKDIAVSTSEISSPEGLLAEQASPALHSWKQNGFVTSPVSIKVLDNQFGWSGDRCDSVEIVVLNNLPHGPASFGYSNDDDSKIFPTKSTMMSPKSKLLGSTSKQMVADQACQTSPCQQLQVDVTHVLQKQQGELKPEHVLSPSSDKKVQHVGPKGSEEVCEGPQVHAAIEKHSVRRPEALNLVKSLSISSIPTVVQKQDETKSTLLTDIGKWLNPDTTKAATEAKEDPKPADLETKESDAIGNVESKFHERTKSPSSKSSTRKKTKSPDKDATSAGKAKESPKRKKNKTYTRQSPRKAMDEGFEVESRNGVISVVKNVCPPDLNKFLRDVESPETTGFHRVESIDGKPARKDELSPKDSMLRKKKKTTIIAANHHQSRQESVELTIKPNMSGRSHNTKSTYSTKSKSTISRRSQKGKKKKVDVDTTSLHKKPRSSKPCNKTTVDAKQSHRKKKSGEAEKVGKSKNSISTVSTKRKAKGSVRSKERLPSRIPSKLILKKTEHDDASVLTSLNSAQFMDAASIINMNFATAWDEIAKASLVIEEAINKIDTSLRNGEGNSRTHDSTIGSEVEKALVILKKHADRLGVKESDLLLAVRSDDESTIETIRRVSSTLSKQNESATLSKRNESGTEYYTTADTNTSAVKTMTLGEEILDIFRMYLPRARTRQ